MHSLDDDHNKAVHENTLMSLEEAKARKAAEEERSRRLWEETQQQNQTGQFILLISVYCIILSYILPNVSSLLCFSQKLKIIYSLWLYYICMPAND